MPGLPPGPMVPPEERFGGPAWALVHLDRAAVLQLVQGGEASVGDVGPLYVAGQQTRRQGCDAGDALESDLADQRANRGFQECGLTTATTPTPGVYDWSMSAPVHMMPPAGVP